MVAGEQGNDKESSMTDQYDEETRRRMVDDAMGNICRDAYAVLDELLHQLEESCEEQTTWLEEIDRQNLRQLLVDIDRVQRVKMLIEQIVDPATRETE